MQTADAATAAPGCERRGVSANIPARQAAFARVNGSSIAQRPTRTRAGDDRDVTRVLLHDAGVIDQDREDRDQKHGNERSRRGKDGSDAMATAVNARIEARKRKHPEVRLGDPQDGDQCFLELKEGDRRTRVPIEPLEKLERLAPDDVQADQALVKPERAITEKGDGSKAGSSSTAPQTAPLAHGCAAKRRGSALTLAGVTIRASDGDGTRRVAGDHRRPPRRRG